MTQKFEVVIFSDASLNDGDMEGQMADKIFELPAKSAGPYRIATELRNHGFSCQIVHLCFYFTKDELEYVCQKYITDETIIVGISTTFWNIQDNQRKKDLLKCILTNQKKSKNARLVVGGTLSAYYKDAIKPDASFDGFAESDFLKYALSLKNKSYKKKFEFTESYIEYKENDYVDYQESKVIEIARGCIFKCNFCSYPLNGKKKLDYIKSKETLTQELTYNFEKYGITNYTLSDDTFNDSTEKLEFLHKIFTSLPFKIKFVCYLRLDLINAHREQIKILKEMGLIGAFFGIETFNHEAGKHIGKGLHPEKNKQLLYDLKKYYWNDDVNITIGLISGLPYETMQSHIETLNYISNDKECLVDRIRPSSLNIPNPLLDKYPYKSEFQINALKYGFYWSNPRSNNWKNANFEIKSREQAMTMAKEIYQVCESRLLVYRGNFSLPLIANISKYNPTPYDIDDLRFMNINNYVSWYLSNKKSMINSYVTNYKSKILS